MQCQHSACQRSSLSSHFGSRILRNAPPPNIYAEDLPSHPPLPNEEAGVYSSLMLTDSDLALTKRKFVKVSGEGEIEIDPNLIQFCVRVTSQKPDINEAKSSVQKREEYILGVLKKSGIPSANISSTSRTIKSSKKLTENEDENDEMAYFRNQVSSLNPQVDVGEKGSKGNVQPISYILKKELNVNCDSMLKYLKVLSACTEKLDQQVLVSQPIIKFTASYLQANKQRCIREAMKCAHEKALELIKSQKSPQVVLGQVYYTMENLMTVENMEEYNDANTGGASAHFEFFKWKKFSKRITCQITSVFELRPWKPRRTL